MELHHLLNVFFLLLSNPRSSDCIFDKKERKKKQRKQTFHILMVFLIVLLFIPSDEKTFFTVILNLTNIRCLFKIIINTALGKCSGKILGKKIRFEYVKGKHSFQF